MAQMPPWPPPPAPPPANKYPEERAAWEDSVGEEEALRQKKAWQAWAAQEQEYIRKSILEGTDPNKIPHPGGGYYGPQEGQGASTWKGMVGEDDGAKIRKDDLKMSIDRGWVTYNPATGLYEDVDPVRGARYWDKDGNLVNANGTRLGAGGGTQSSAGTPTMSGYVGGTFSGNPAIDYSTEGILKNLAAQGALDTEKSAFEYNRARTGYGEAKAKQDYLDDFYGQILGVKFSPYEVKGTYQPNYGNFSSTLRGGGAGPNGYPWDPSGKNPIPPAGSGYYGPGPVGPGGSRGYVPDWLDMGQDENGTLPGMKYDPETGTQTPDTSGFDPNAGWRSPDWMPNMDNPGEWDKWLAEWSELNKGLIPGANTGNSFARTTPGGTEGPTVDGNGNVITLKPDKNWYEAGRDDVPLGKDVTTGHPPDGSGGYRGVSPYYDIAPYSGGLGTANYTLSGGGYEQLDTAFDPTNPQSWALMAPLAAQARGDLTNEMRGLREYDIGGGELDRAKGEAVNRAYGRVGAARQAMMQDALGYVKGSMDSSMYQTPGNYTGGGQSALSGLMNQYSTDKSYDLGLKQVAAQKQGNKSNLFGSLFQTLGSLAASAIPGGNVLGNLVR